MKDRSDDPSHHERTLLPWSYISLLVRHQDNVKKNMVNTSLNNTFLSFDRFSIDLCSPLRAVWIARWSLCRPTQYTLISEIYTVYYRRRHTWFAARGSLLTQKARQFIKLGLIVFVVFESKFDRASAHDAKDRRIDPSLDYFLFQCSRLWHVLSCLWYI